MKKIFFVLTVLIFCAATFIQVCAETISFTSPEKPAVVKAGKTFTITLESNRSTKFQWSLASISNPKVVSMVKNVYKAQAGAKTEAAKAKTAKTKAIGKETWTFKAVAPGTAKITMIYNRPGMTMVPPIRTAEFNVTVK